MVPENSETKNRGVSVKHRGMCVKCWDVINLWKPKTQQQTQKSEAKNRDVSDEHRGVRVWNIQMWTIYENPKLDVIASWTPLQFYSLVHVGS